MYIHIYIYIYMYGTIPRKWQPYKLRLDKTTTFSRTEGLGPRYVC